MLFLCSSETVIIKERTDTGPSLKTCVNYTVRARLKLSISESDATRCSKDSILLYASPH